MIHVFHRWIVLTAVVSAAALASGCLSHESQNASGSRFVSGGDEHDRMWENSLGMPFVQLPGMSARLCIWETRTRDFKAFIDATGYDASAGMFSYEKNYWVDIGRSWRDPGFNQTWQHPVVGVSWEDAMAFCRWLTETERRAGRILPSQEYRLPTEKEWETAAMSDPENKALTGNYHPVRHFDEFDLTSPVGSFPPNQLGIYDMIGNVWEYCLDAARPGSTLKVIRGGAWQNYNGKFVGPDVRGRCKPDMRISLYGFRVALAPVDNAEELRARATSL